MRRVFTSSTFGGISLVISSFTDVRPNSSDEVLVRMDVSDHDIPELVQIGLERLAGQGKITEKIRATCVCVADLPTVESREEIVYENYDVYDIGGNKILSCVVSDQERREFLGRFLGEGFAWVRTGVTTDVSGMSPAERGVTR